MMIKDIINSKKEPHAPAVKKVTGKNSLKGNYDASKFRKPKKTVESN